MMIYELFFTNDLKPTQASVVGQLLSPEVQSVQVTFPKTYSECKRQN